MPAKAKTGSKKKATVKKTTAPKATAKKVTAKAVAKKTVAKKTAAKKTTAKKVAVKKSSAKRTTTQKAAAKKTAVQKAPAKKATTKKVAAKKTTVKKAPAKKSTVKKASTKKSTIPKTTLKKTATKKATPKKTTTKKATAPKAAIKKPSTKKSAAKRARPILQALPNTTFMGIPPYQERKGEEYMNDAQRAHFIDILTAWKQSLMQGVDRTVSHMKDEAANFPDPNDRASQEEEFSLELRTRDRERKLIKKIEESLEHVKEDDFGYCEACGIEIGIRRLEARPTATLCIDCKTLAEHKERASA